MLNHCGSKEVSSQKKARLAMRTQIPNALLISVRRASKSAKPPYQPDRACVRFRTLLQNPRLGVERTTPYLALAPPRANPFADAIDDEIRFKSRSLKAAYSLMRLAVLGPASTGFCPPAGVVRIIALAASISPPWSGNFLVPACTARPWGNRGGGRTDSSSRLARRRQRIDELCVTTPPSR